MMCIDSLVLYIYSAQPQLFCFSRHMPSVHYTKQLPSGLGPSANASKVITATGAYGSLVCMHG